MKKIITSLAVFLMFISSQAGAETIITNEDTTNYWKDGYWSNNNLPSYADVYGAPNIVNAAFTIDNHALTSITIQYYFNQIDRSWTQGVGFTKTYQAIAPGDWFFSIDDDTDWEYVLSTTSDSRNVATIDGIKAVQEDTEWALYEKNLAYNSHASYESAYAPSGWGERGIHPALAELATTDKAIEGHVSFSGWGNDWTNGIPSVGQANNPNSWYSATWTFTTPFALTPGSTLTYGFALTCANDVLKDSIAVPTPEPGTAFLLGFGLLGLGAMARRRR